MHFGGDGSDYSSDTSSIDISHLVDQHVAARQQQQPTESSPTTAAVETPIGDADNVQDDGEDIKYKAQHNVADNTTSPEDHAEEKQPAADEEDPAKKPPHAETNNGKMIRIIMGKSVQAWRQRKDKTAALNLQHVILRHGTDATLPNLESSRLETNKHVAHISNEKTRQQYTGRLRMTGSSSGLVECVAIWDATRQCHVLEIANAVVTDLVVVEVKGGDNAAAFIPAQNDPVLQLRHAEKTLVRKRRAASKATSRASKVAKTNK
jgi:hypothetical protein